MRRAGEARINGAVRTVVILVATASVLASTGCSTNTNGRGSHAPVTTTSQPAPTSQPVTPPSTPTPSPPSSSPSPTPTIPSLAARTAALSHASGGLPSVIVGVPGGFEAMTWDQATHVGFWYDPTTSTTWQPVGSSVYPWVAAIGGPPQASATGALLIGMQHATFIVTGNFSGDGSGNAVAYTTGANGWGVIKAEPNGNIGPSVNPSQPTRSVSRLGSSSSAACSRHRTATRASPSPTAADQPRSSSSGSGQVATSGGSDPAPRRVGHPVAASVARRSGVSILVTAR